MNDNGGNLLLLGFFSGVMSTLIADYAVGFWRRSREAAKRDEANKLIEAHGLSAFSYLATVGTEDEALRLALDRVTLGSQVVLDANGNVVGRVIPKVVRSAAEGAKLRLVVDNTKG